ncbi:MAG: hypothetical protein QOH21_362 [Acidobacteriota bacterium]|nr:hypothetical protein [Acidobacteriota bacterium]
MQPAPNAVPSQRPRPRPSARADGVSLPWLLRWMHLHSCELIIWAFFVSAAVYKRWYIATAVALLITMVAGAVGVVRLRRFLPAIFPFLLYHAYQCLGVLWTQYREGVAFTAVIAIIGSVVAFLFWSLVRNHSLDAISDIFVRLPYPALLLTAYELISKSGSERSGGYSLTFMAMSVPFCYEQLMRKRRPWRAGIALLIAFLVLVVSRSRAPLSAALLSGVLAFLFIGRGFAARFRIVAIAAVAVPVLLAALLAVETTRTVVLMTWVRFSKQEVVEEGLYIPAERQDVVRADLAENIPRLLLAAQPLGIGLGAYPFYHERVYGYRNSIHNIIALWAIEGGVVLLLIVFWMLWRHVRALFRAMKTPARAFAICVLINTFAALAIGVYHRIDATFWVALGLGIGVRDQYVRRRVRRALVRPAARLSA